MNGCLEHSKHLKPINFFEILSKFPHELQLLILVKLPYPDLRKMCILGYTNPSVPYAKFLTICKDDWFWLCKIKRDFPEVNEMHVYTCVSTWRSEYRYHLKRLEKDFIWAIKNKDTIQVSSLLRLGVDPSVDDNFAIRFASENGHTPIVKLLLEDPRADPSVKDNYAIRWASAFEHTSTVKMLLKDSRVDPSARHGLIWAIRWASSCESSIAKLFVIMFVIIKLYRILLSMKRIFLKFLI